MEEKEMYEVSEGTFNDFVKFHNLKLVQGEVFHSDYYVDNQGNKLAYRETSSYGADVIYKIKDEKFRNWETVRVVKEYLKF